MFSKNDANSVRKTMLNLSKEIKQAGIFSPPLVESAELLSHRVTELKNEKPLHVVHIGYSSVGKTTCVKALVASETQTVRDRLDKALPEDDDPNTATPVHVVHGSKKDISLHYQDGGSPKGKNLSVDKYAGIVREVESITDRETASVTLQKPQTLNNLAFAEVQSTASILQAGFGLRMVDTPGLDTDDAPEVMSVVSPADVVVVYQMPPPARNPLIVRLLGKLSSGLSKVEDIFLICNLHRNTDRDEVLEKSVKAYKDFFREELLDSRIFAFNAKYVQELKRNTTDRVSKGRLENSGFPDFENALRDLADEWKTSNGFPRYCSTFHRLVHPMHTNAVSYLDDTIEGCRANITELNDQITKLKEEERILKEAEVDFNTKFEAFTDTLVTQYNFLTEEYLHYLASDAILTKLLLQLGEIEGAYRETTIEDRAEELSNKLDQVFTSRLNEWVNHTDRGSYRWTAVREVVEDIQKYIMGKFKTLRIDAPRPLGVEHLQIPSMPAITPFLNLKPMLRKAGGWSKLRVGCQNLLSDWRRARSSNPGLKTFEKRFRDAFQLTLLNAAASTRDTRGNRLLRDEIKNVATRHLQAVTNDVLNRLQEEAATRRVGWEEILAKKKEPGGTDFLEQKIKQCEGIKASLNTSFDQLRGLFDVEASKTSS